MIEDEKLFGMSKEEIRKQWGRKDLEGDFAQSPIVEGETLEPCIRGAKKILEDPEMLKMVRNILTRGGLHKNKTDELANYHTTQKSFAEQNKTLEEMKNDLEQNYNENNIDEIRKILKI